MPCGLQSPCRHDLGCRDFLTLALHLPDDVLVSLLLLDVLCVSFEALDLLLLREGGREREENQSRAQTTPISIGLRGFVGQVGGSLHEHGGGRHCVRSGDPASP